jgi:hypothetical protein
MSSKFSVKNFSKDQDTAILSFYKVEQLRSTRRIPLTPV